MFYGRIRVTLLSARDLPWNMAKGLRDSELRPYLVISLDGREKARVGYQNQEVVGKQLETRRAINEPLRTFTVPSEGPYKDLLLGIRNLLRHLHFAKLAFKHRALCIVKHREGSLTALETVQQPS